jgi:hypothetical protein
LRQSRQSQGDPAKKPAKKLAKTADKPYGRRSGNNVADAHKKTEAA